MWMNTGRTAYVTQFLIYRTYSVDSESRACGWCSGSMSNGTQC